MKAHYSYVKSSTALGQTYEFQGPGIGRSCNSVHLLQPLNEWAAKCLAERSAEIPLDLSNILRMLNDAYEAGRAAKAEELRHALGVLR